MAWTSSFYNGSFTSVLMSSGKTLSGFCISGCLFFFNVSYRWVGFEKPGFSGELYILEKGLYANPEDWGAQNYKISSMQPVFHVRNWFVKNRMWLMRLFIRLLFLIWASFPSVLQDTLMEATKFKVSALHSRLHMKQIVPQPSWLSVPVL